jgi:hypothetical protein
MLMIACFGSACACCLGREKERHYRRAKTVVKIDHNLEKRLELQRMMEVTIQHWKISNLKE